MSSVTHPTPTIHLPLPFITYAYDSPFLVILNTNIHPPHWVMAPLCLAS